MELQEVIDSLSELENDSSVPKNIRVTLSEMINELKDNKNLSLKINKCLSQLDEIAEDVNLPTFIRTRIFEVASMLEALH